MVDLIKDSPEEAYYDEDVVYEINTYGADFTVDGLINRFDREDIFRPHFQRNFVWNLRQASRFIESILLGLPIPSVFLYREEDSRRHLIVDGLQRLSSLHGFASGRFPNTDRSFRLKDVQARYEGRSIHDLDLSDQRRFFDTVIHSIIIQQMAPDNDRTSVFHIFERLNSNGTPLHAQEMRAAIFHGPFQELLVQLNQNLYWRRIFGVEHKRSKDQELVLRFFALHFKWHDYRKPMTKFLNQFMGNNRHLDRYDGHDLSEIWDTTIKRVFDALGKDAFKPAKALNVALYDAVMVGVCGNPSAAPDSIRQNYFRLVENPEFRYLIERATSDEATVGKRIEIALQAFGAPA